MAGPDCLGPGDVSAGIEWFSRAIDRAAPNEKEWLAVTHLYRGICHDILGHRSLAIDDYERVLSRPDVASTHERARQCLLNPCTREQVVGLLKDMTQAPGAAAPTAANRPQGGKKK
jgi:hypothetical protein